MPAARSLKARALQWLTQREHSRVELKRKLARHARQLAAPAPADAGVVTSVDADGPEHDGEPDEASIAEQVEATLDWLERHGYLSAERFVESRVHARAARYGNLRIRQELQQHALQVTPELAAALGASEIERAGVVRARRFPQWPADAAERARQARFLMGRGFSSDAVRAALRAPTGVQVDGRQDAPHDGSTVPERPR